MNYRVDLMVGANALPTLSASLQWQVSDMPHIDSVSPTVLRQGTAYVFSVRGLRLSNVVGLVFEPGNGIQILSTSPTYTVDGLGELVSVTIQVSPGATIGSSVVRLAVPGVLTDSQPTSANLISVVAP